MNTIIKWSFLVASSLSQTVYAQQPHAAAPMMTISSQSQPQADETDVKAEMQQRVISQFKSAYLKQGEPKIAVFWNRQFDDQLSQWQQDSRSTRKDEFEYNRRYTDKNGNTRSYSFDAHEKSSDYTETRIEQEKRFGMYEHASFGFNSAFTTSMLKVPVQLIDRATIMRLTQHNQDLKTHIENDSDYQKIEVAALIDHADYFMEILLADDMSEEFGWVFLVTVKSTKTGQIVAMLKSNGSTPYQAKPKEYWVATSNGYEKVSDPLPVTTVEDLGEVLAFETMQSLTQIWQ